MYISFYLDLNYGLIQSTRFWTDVTVTLEAKNAEIIPKAFNMYSLIRKFSGVKNMILVHKLIETFFKELIIEKM